jgi:hypothetical protein
MQNNITIGMDLGDGYYIAVVFDAEGNELEVGKVVKTKAGVSKYFRRYKGSTVAIEAGTHSPRISRLLDQMGGVCKVAGLEKTEFSSNQYRMRPTRRPGDF